ncbi:MAG: hypothetical protein IJI84_06335 [Clostridia bacterium]|nr:hypothetical protein [Clostridia bacterium]
MELNEIISRIPKSRNTLLLNKSKVKSNNDLKKYTNKPSEELLKLVNAKKITDTDFCIILYNKLTNYIEKNKEDILNSNSQLSNDLKNFF